ncbi:MAG TPA: SIMPL domain-containing protein [Actinomycetota bacterium]|nr:SIMPL domain-containing protein [Actinomycetota bacterium]
MAGLTVMGQATIKDRGEAARDAAIAEAVGDARDQAQAAADAAGIQLGEVLDLEISAMPIVYPAEEIAPPDAGIAAGSAGGATQGVSGPVTIDTAVPADRYLGSATVTITWAIG